VDVVEHEHDGRSRATDSTNRRTAQNASPGADGVSVIPVSSATRRAT
jgi:hypothetical protein